MRCLLVYSASSALDVSIVGFANKAVLVKASERR
jgi:hypothetical protein